MNKNTQLCPKEPK